MSDKLNEILHDTWPNIYRPPHDFKPPSMYTVQTWDEQHKCVRYHSVADAIDYEDARDVIQHLHPEQNVIAVSRHKFSTAEEKSVEKPVEKEYL